MPKDHYRIAPSLLSANVLQLGQEVGDLLQAGADMIHLDVMDNHYVPNLTFGPLHCKALKEHFPQLIIDVHLMANPVDMLIQQFAQSSANRISIHPEATNHLHRTLQLIRTFGCQAGLVINPATSLDCLKWTFQQLDFVLFMSVNPGFADQTFISEVLPKIENCKNLYPDLTIAVDGGVNLETIKNLAQAGASQFIIGSAMFQSKDYSKTLLAFRHLLQSAP